MAKRRPIQKRLPITITVLVLCALSACEPTTRPPSPSPTQTAFPTLTRLPIYPTAESGFIAVVRQAVYTNTSPGMQAGLSALEAHPQVSDPANCTLAAFFEFDADALTRWFETYRDLFGESPLDPTSGD